MTAGRLPLVAIVQRRKDDGWVLPKGKLKPGETPAAAAQREASEETGHRVTVREYLGVVSYESGDKPKIVQFWRMASQGETGREPMRDIKAVKWLPLEAAIARLSQPVERAFLAHIGGRSVKLARLGATGSKPRPGARLKLRKHSKLRLDKNVRVDQPLPAEHPAATAAPPNFLRRLFLRLQDGKQAAPAPHDHGRQA